MGCGASAPSQRQGTIDVVPPEPLKAAGTTASKGTRKQGSVDRIRFEAADTAAVVRKSAASCSSGDGASAGSCSHGNGHGKGDSRGSTDMDPLARLASMDVDRLAEEFAKCDTSGDHRLSVDELSNLLARLFGDEVLTAVTEDGTNVVKKLLAALDTDGSGDVDLDELQAAWRAWFGQAVNPKRCLIIVDVQNDFIDGTLGLKGCPAGQDGAAVVPVINAMRKAHAWDAVVVSLDWHVQDHCSFHEAVTSGASPAPLHPSQDPEEAKNADVFATVMLLAPDEASPMRQTLWPRHCVQDTWGSECHADLHTDPSDIIVRKGTDPRVDSYSAFYDNQKLNQTSLLSELRARGVTHVFVTGLALDVCVAFTALHAAEEGFVTTVVADACAGVTADGIAEKKDAFARAGIAVTESSDLSRLFSQSSLAEVVGAAHRVQLAKSLVQSCAEEDGHGCPSA